MHGGDVYRNQITLDFSVNVNPMGMPKQVREALSAGCDLAEVYPDPRCEALREALGKHFSWDPEKILCGNGASELIQAICRWRKPKTALLLAPGFSGYQKALRAEGCQWDSFFLKEEEGFGLSEESFQELKQTIREKKPELFFLANPSNPVGWLMPREWMAELAKVCETTGTILVIDECFMELVEDPKAYSMTEIASDHSKQQMEEMVSDYSETKAIAGDPKLMILRAFTKSFAMPGIRLGYLLCGSEIPVEALEEQLSEWNVSLPAQMAGAAALSMLDGLAEDGNEEAGEENWLAESRRVIAEERSYLEAELKELGAYVYPSKVNYLLFRWEEDAPKHDLTQKDLPWGDASKRDLPQKNLAWGEVPKKATLYDALLAEGVLIRDCRDYDGLGAGYYRVAVKRHDENVRLIELMKKQK